MAPGSIFYHISFQSTFICIFTFLIYIIKYQKYTYLIILSLSDLTFASGREGIDNPFIALIVSSCLFVYVRRTFEEPPTGLIPWFSKTEGNTYATIVASPFPLQGKPTQAHKPLSSTTIRHNTLPLGVVHFAKTRITDRCSKEARGKVVQRNRHVRDDST